MSVYDWIDPFEHAKQCYRDGERTGRQSGRNEGHAEAMRSIGAPEVHEGIRAAANQLGRSLFEQDPIREAAVKLAHLAADKGYAISKPFDPVYQYVEQTVVIRPFQITVRSLAL